MKTTRIVIGVLKREDGRILIGRREANNPKAHSQEAGRWEFPGGTVEEGEELIDALKREFLEETGLVIADEDIKPLAENTYPHRRDVTLYFFSIERSAGTISMNVHMGLSWETPMEIYNRQDLINENMRHALSVLVNGSR